MRNPFGWMSLKPQILGNVYGLSLPSEGKALLLSGVLNGAHHPRAKRSGARRVHALVSPQDTMKNHLVLGDLDAPSEMLLMI